MRIRCLASIAIAIRLASVASYAQAPVPFINQPLVPDATAPGGAAFTLTVNGTGFVSNSVVKWNGAALTATFVNQSQLKATVPAADIATASTATVTVVNPGPGGGTSNAAFFTVTPNTGNSVAFTLASSPDTGNSPDSVAVGDFNGDGKLDLAVANAYNFTVSILLGDGTGNFTLASSLATGNWPMSVAVGDFNGDGNLDLAVGENGAVSVWLGDGTGNFTLVSSLPVSDEHWSVAVGDFNGDGKLDLAVTNYVFGNPSNTVSVLLGDGTGNFSLASSPTVGAQPCSVVIGDFNGDGKLDLAVANSGSATVSILLGDGTGNFTLASSPYVFGFPNSVAVGDFNEDGNLDLAVTNADTVSILLGDGTGKFTLASSTALDEPYSVAVGDFNGDGKPDLATANYGDGTASILLGDGTGNFTLASSPTVGAPEPWSVALGDFNGDGKLDLAVASYAGWGWGGTVSILLQVPPPPAVTLSPASLNFGNQNLGTSSAPQSAALTNGTSGVLTITGISIAGANSGDYSQTNNCGTSLGAGASCSISVVFKPTALGTRSATLQVTDSDPSSPQTASLTGVGTQPAVTLSPASLTFPWQLIGTSSSSLPVTLTDSGTGILTITGIVASGPFSQTNNCGSSVTPGANCTINVVFLPTSEGTATGAVTITDNAPGSPQAIGLTGQGLGKPSLSGKIMSTSKNGTTLTATLQVKDSGTGAADNVQIKQITFQTLSGTGTVTLSGPALPVSVGNLAIGGSTNVTLTLNVPATVTKFSLTEKGTLQNIAGSSLNFAVAQVVYP